MKRIGNLYERIISVENLRLADEKARRGKLRSYGVRRHDKHREANILALHEALRDKTFRTSKYDVFMIHEPKERVIYRLPYYPDRIVHHAIMNVLEPIWVSVFTHNTYSCIKGRGIEGCARHAEKMIRRYEGRPLYCLKIDIRKCYPSMSHEVLKGIVRRKIKDKDLLWLLDEIIDSAPGLPIGNYLSQYLANLNFAYFMHWVNEELKLECEEYADDFVFYSESKERLREAFPKIRRYIEEELRLSVKDNWQVFPVAENCYDKHGRAIDFVGYRFFKRQKLMRKGIKKNLCRMVARLRGRALTAKEYRQRIASWLGWARHSDSKHLLQTIIGKSYGSIL
jgi:RNA-directed DNA polymerase